MTLFRGVLWLALAGLLAACAGPGGLDAQQREMALRQRSLNTLEQASQLGSQAN